MQGSPWQQHPDIKLIRRQQAEHGGYGSLHRIPRVRRNPLSHHLRVQGLDPKKQIGERRELPLRPPASGSPRVDELVGDASAASARAREDASDGWAGGGAAELERRRDCEEAANKKEGLGSGRAESGGGGGGGGGHRPPEAWPGEDQARGGGGGGNWVVWLETSE